MTEECMCCILTRKPAVVAGVTVVPIKLCWDRDGVTHQQEDEPRSCHFGTRETFFRCHLHKVNIALTTFLENSTWLKIRCSKNNARLCPRLPAALTSIKVVQPSIPTSPNPSYPAPSAPFHLRRSCWPKNLSYPTLFKLRSPLFPAHFIPLPSLYPQFTCFLPLPE